MKNIFSALGSAGMDRIIMFLLIILVVFVSFLIYLFWNVNQSVAKMNKESIEKCAYLDCTIQPMGTLSCVERPVSLLYDDKILPFNLSLIGPLNEKSEDLVNAV